MDPSGSSHDLFSFSLSNLWTIGGALVLVAGVLIHRHQNRFLSLFIKNLIADEMNRRIDWNRLTISAEVSHRRVSKNNNLE
jgi:cell division protein FtsL